MVATRTKTSITVASASGHGKSSTASSTLRLPSDSSFRPVRPAPVGEGGASNGDGEETDGNGDDDVSEEGGVSGTRINLTFKTLLLLAILDKMLTAKGCAPWAWKGSEMCWKREGKPLQIKVMQAWCQLPRHERTMYGGSADETNILCKSTSKRFMSKMKADYHKNKNT